MPTFVALLRGVNVGGKHTLKMADLRDVLERAGARNVATYIQSGNAVFEHSARSERALSERLQPAISEAAGFVVPLVARTADAWREVIDANPFPKADAKHLHVTFFAAPVADGAFAHVDLASFAPDELVARGREAYLFLPNGLGRSKLAAVRPKGVPEGTTRNWNTVLKLAEMLSGRT